MVLQPSVAHALKHQRGLDGRIAEHTLSTIEILTILMESHQEEVGMIESRQGETRQRLHHISVEIPAVFLLQTVCGT